jgi:hypothetical protein
MRPRLDISQISRNVVAGKRVGQLRVFRNAITPHFSCLLCRGYLSLGTICLLAALSAYVNIVSVWCMMLPFPRGYIIPSNGFFICIDVVWHGLRKLWRPSPSLCYFTVNFFHTPGFILTLCVGLTVALAFLFRWERRRSGEEWHWVDKSIWLFATGVNMILFVLLAWAGLAVML